MVNDFYVANTTLKKSIEFTRRQINDLQKADNAAQNMQQLDHALYYAAYMRVANKDSALRAASRQVLDNLADYPKSQQFFVEQIVTQTNDIIEKNNAVFQSLGANAELPRTC